MNILLIAPVFYGYDEEIVKVLQKYYDCVYFCNEVPFSNQTRYKYIVKVFGFLKPLFWKRYAKRILDIINNKSITKILLIRGEEIPEFLFKEIYRTNPSIDITNYQWDSFRNNANAELICKYAAHNFTFDREDAERNKRYEYLPLFYSWKNVINYNREIKNDVLFFGSYSEERFNEVKNLITILESQGITYKILLYIPFLSFLTRVFTGCRIPYRYITLKTIKKDRYQLMAESCRCLFDLPSPLQKGATMRTIEALSLKKKLITTNRNLALDDFYSEDNILFWPITDYSLLKSFIYTEYNESHYSTLMSIESWLEKMNIIKRDSSSQ